MMPDAQRTLGHRIKSRKLDNIPPFGVQLTIESGNSSAVRTQPNIATYICDVIMPLQKTRGGVFRFQFGGKHSQIYQCFHILKPHAKPMNNENI